MTTLFQMAEMAKRKLNSGFSGPNVSIGQQELILAVKQSFGTVVKNNWFQNKNDGVNELGGEFIYSFKNQDILFDNDLTEWYTVLPSSYLSLPHELGIQFVGIMESGNASQSQSEPMVRVFNGFSQLSRGLAVGNLQTRKGFYIQGSRIIYLKMTDQLAQKKVLIKLAVALDSFDEDAQINIGPELQDQIIEMVVQKYLVEKQVSEVKPADKLS